MFSGTHADSYRVFILRKHSHRCEFFFGKTKEFYFFFVYFKDFLELYIVLKVLYMLFEVFFIWYIGRKPFHNLLEANSSTFYIN